MTERRQASEALKESKALHRILMEQALEGLIIAQGDPTRIVLANKAMANITGYSIEELTSFTPEQLQGLLHPEDRNVFFERFRDRLKGRKVPEYYEFRAVRKDGREIWLAMTAVRITHRSKPAVLALFTDITERKRAEQTAEKERDRLFSVLDVMPAFVYLQASDYSVPFVNRRFRESFGDPGDTPCYKAFYGRRKPCDPCITLRVLKTRAPQTWEWISREGRTYMVHEDLFQGSDGREMVLGIGVDITGTKQAERKLQDSEERYRSLFEDSPISIWEEDFSEVKRYIERLRVSGVIDFKTYFERHPQAVVKCASKVKVTDINRASLEMYGAKSKQELISGFDKILARESYDPFREELISIAEGRTVFEREAVIRNLRGRKNYVVIRWMAAPGHEKTLSKVLVSVVDITQRKQAEEALREGEEKYRLLVQNLTDMIVKFDTQGRLLFVSPSYCKTFGKSEDEILGKKFMPLVHKDDRAYVKETLAETNEAPHVIYLEERAKTVDGWRWQAWMNTAVLDQDGNVVHVVAVGRDITQRRQAEEALRRQEEQYRALVETAQEGIAITDHKENLTFVNRAFADLLGYRKDELLGKNLRDLSEESQYTTFKKETVRRKAGAVSRYEAVLLTKSKRSVPVYISAVPMTDEGGRFTGTLGVLTDLTEIRKIQEYNTLLSTSRSLARSLNSDQVLQVGVQKITQTLKAQRCATMIVHDSSSNSAVHLRMYSSSKKGKDRTRVLKLNITKDIFSSYQRSLRAHPDFQVSNVRSDLVPELGKLILRKAGMTSALIIPVFQRNRMLAVFHVGMAKESRTFSTDQVRLALTMANQVGAALQNCKLLDDVRREHLRAMEQTRLLKAQYREQKMMFELTQTLTSASNLDQMLKWSTKKVVELLKVDLSSVGLVEPAGRGTTVGTVYPLRRERDRRAVGFTFTPEAFPQLSRFYRRSTPIIWPDVSKLPGDDSTKSYFLGRGIKSALVVPLISRGRTLGFLTANTTERVHHFTDGQIRLLQTISNPIAVAIENYQLLDDLRRKYGQIEEQATTLKRQTWEKDILLKVSQALSKAMKPEEVSQVASRVVGLAMGVDRCAVILASPDGETLEIRALFSKGHLRARRIIGQKFPAGESRHLKELLGKGKTLALRRSGRLPDIGRAKRHWLEAGIKSTLAAGMFFGKTLVGVLSVSFTEDERTFTRDESKLIQAIANQIAIAVENARLLEEVEKHSKNVRRLAAEVMNAQENARKDIAQELHDHEGQMLLAMKMNLDRMQRDLSARPDHPKATEELLSDTRELLAQTIEEIRTLTFELRPPMLEDFGLVPALKWLLDGFAKRSGIQFSLKTKGKERRYSREIEVALFRIAQEALTNVSKHARATEVSMLVSHQASNVVMSVRDNGVGFEAEKTMSSPRGGMGLFNIKERVSLLGGKLEIASQPRKGTTLNINIPSSEVKHEEDQVVGR